jgi:8-oxo-dGTP pyrophosphatase MutT (NUDIX family)
MLKSAWDEIESLYTLPTIDPSTIAKFKSLRSSQVSHTKGEGNPLHYCSFFLPYDQDKQMIYLGFHKKADDWIPPGGHIESGETPSDAAIREMKEELGVDIAKDMLEPFDLSVKQINRPDKGCMAHYDVWHLVHIKLREFDYLKSEYYDAGWFTIPEGLAKITKNPDFAAIIAKLQA